VFADVPTTYLTWMVRTIEALSVHERRIVEAERLERGESCRARSSRRDHSTRSPYSPPLRKLPAGITPDVILRIISAGRQTLAKRLHPDVGGDLETFKQVNVAADFLTQQARALSQQQAGGVR